MCVVLFLQNVIVTILAQSVTTVMKKEFVSVSREQQGLSVISVCRDIIGTARAVDVSNCPSSATPPHPTLHCLCFFLPACAAPQNSKMKIKEQAFQTPPA